MTSLPFAKSDASVFWFPAAGRGFWALTANVLESMADLLDWPPHHNFCFAATASVRALSIDHHHFLVSGYGYQLIYVAGALPGASLRPPRRPELRSSSC